MRLTSPLCSILCAAAALACAKSGAKVADSSAGTVATADTSHAMAAAPTRTLALSDLAGSWQVVSRPADGKDTTATRVTLNAKADTAGWTMVGGKNKPVPLHVTVSGDSVVESSDPYPSLRRKGVTVQTVGTLRLKDGKLVGKTVAHYKVKASDSVLVLNTEATKAQ